MKKREDITQELMIYKIGINALTFLKKEYSYLAKLIQFCKV